MKYKCCNKPEYVRAYIVCWPFKAKYCLNCGEVIGDMNPVVSWAFKHFFSYIWFGVVKVYPNRKIR